MHNANSPAFETTVVHAGEDPGVFERATTRAHMSPAPVIVCASRTSGIAASCAPTASWPPCWLL